MKLTHSIVALSCFVENISSCPKVGSFLPLAFMFLKGPTDMLTLYENRYKTELQKFAAMQIGRRRRDDYTDGTIRIPIESPPQ